MQLHIDEIARRRQGRPRGAAARPGRPAHTGALKWPANITPILLPSRSPKLNPVEQVWQILRANFLSNRVFATYDEIIAAACEAWNSLVALPVTIASSGLRDWAHIGQS